jgi:hypothetical protein
MEAADPADVPVSWSGLLVELLPAQSTESRGTWTMGLKGPTTRLHVGPVPPWPVSVAQEPTRPTVNPSAPFAWH